jgi:ubiquinone/menaquinone biosynthesis C-methylase UbiE
LHFSLATRLRMVHQGIPFAPRDDMSTVTLLTEIAPSGNYHDPLAPSNVRSASKPTGDTRSLFSEIARRWRRERRRRKVGRAYDMALEISHVLPRDSRVLDVGCGNGYIAHHLSAFLTAEVLGIDLAPGTEAAIKYQPFDGKTFPIAPQSVDAILLCYVLHHAQDLKTVLGEMERTLKPGGLVVVYEDLPDTAWDRLACTLHDRKWRGRTGPCNFRGADEWRRLFAAAGFQEVTMRRLSRWRNFAHPVSRGFYLLKWDPSTRRAVI